MNWKIGELPADWERGESLRVTNAYYRYGRRVALSLYAARPYDGACTECTLELVQFDYAERHKVAEWLRWYFDVEHCAEGRAQYLAIWDQIR